MTFPLLGRHNDRLKLLRSLAKGSGREASGCFAAEGLRVIRELLSSPLRVRLLLCEAQAGGEELELAHLAVRRGAEVFFADSQLLEQLSSAKTSQGLLAVAEIPKYTWDEVLSCPRVLVLEGIQDPGNVGTLLRSGRAFGFGGALCLGGADPFNARAVRSSAGAAFVMPLMRLSEPADIEACFGRMRSAGLALVTAAAHGGTPLTQAVFPGRAALLLGAEVRGVSRMASSVASLEVTIPLQGSCESLNVAVAGSLLMYEMGRTPRSEAV
ncbi:RNA methyltransferase [bacterium]|nr:RNA methyltransferase [bacterium]